jgi:hypothetical protein
MNNETGRRANSASWRESSSLNFRAGTELRLLIPLTVGTSRRLALIEATRSIQALHPTKAAPAGPPSSITIQQIVNQPAAPLTASGPIALRLPLFSICGLGVLLCFVWMLLVMRAQGVNDHLVIHMKYLEKNYMGATITNMTMLDKLFTPAVRDQRRWPRVLRDTMLVNELTIDDATGKPETPRLPRWGTVVRI